MHIVHSPDEAEKLKKEISRRRSEVSGWNGGSKMENGGGDDGVGDLEYDIVVHGSVDHVCLFSLFFPFPFLLPTTQDAVWEIMGTDCHFRLPL